MKNKPKILYMVQINLAGLHDYVYKLTWTPDLDAYYDSTGDISYSINDQDQNGQLVQRVFTNRKNAETFLMGAIMVRDFFTAFLKGR